MSQSIIILAEIYTAITTAPEILVEAPEFTKQLITKILPLANSDADNDTVKKAINQLYCQFEDVTEQIKAAFHRKNLHKYKAKIHPDYMTVKNDFPDIEKLEKSLSQRIQQDSNTSSSDAKN